MNEDRKLTEPGIKLIQHFEGCKEPHHGKVKAYKCPAGVTTIGWGHTNHHGRKFGISDIWTMDECNDELRKDMEIFEKDVRKLVKVPLTDYQFSALVSFDYNTGALHKSTLLKHVNNGDFADAALEFKKWNKATVNGKKQVMKGLTRRRNSEAIMFAGLSDENFDGVADDPMPQQVDDPDV
jgi:lysozyme